MPEASSGAQPLTIGLAQRKRQLVRDELSDAALKAMTVQGYEGTTVDDIVRAAGVSRRTFFRYFTSKDEVFAYMLGDGKQVAAALAARPEDEPLAVALRKALVGSVCVPYRDLREKGLAMARLTFGTPALTARYLERQARCQECLAIEISRRAGDDDCGLHSRLAASVALVALESAQRQWCKHDGLYDLGDYTNEAFELVAEVLNAPLTRAPSSRP